MKRYFYTLLHLFYPAGIEPLRFTQTQSVSNVQSYYTTPALPAVLPSRRLLEPALDGEKNLLCTAPAIHR